MAAAVYTLIAWIVYIGRIGGFYGGRQFWYMLVTYIVPLGLFIAIAIMLFLKKSGLVTGILFCAVALFQFFYSLYRIRLLSYYHPFSYIIQFIADLVFVFAWAVLGAWIIMRATGKKNSITELLTKYWYFPAGVVVLAKIFEMSGQIYEFGEFLAWWIAVAVFGGLALFISRWVVNPDEIAFQAPAVSARRPYSPGNMGWNPYPGNQGYRMYDGPVGGYPGQNPYPGNQGYPNPNPYQNPQGNPGQNPYQDNQGNPGQNSYPGNQENGNAESPEQNGQGAETCPQCGHPINPGDMFCTNCGHRNA